MGELEPGLFSGRPLRLARLRCERGSVDVVAHRFSCQVVRRRGGVGESGGFGRASRLLQGRDRRRREREVGRAGRGARPDALELFAQSLAPSDFVALEVTVNAWEIARILERHVARVIVVSPADTGIRQARAKTDRLDARALAKLLGAGRSQVQILSPRSRFSLQVAGFREPARRSTRRRGPSRGPFR
ncbi:MAG: family transposase [Conexibacter sp.]|nr:family transposase [Conexibacter sp.]